MYEHKFLIFTGTVEGRMITEFLSKKNVEVHIYAMMDYNDSMLPDKENTIVRIQCLDEEQMYEQMKKENYDMVIDASHPYAKEVTANIVAACIRSRMEYTRLIRAKAGIPMGNDIWYVDSHEEAVEYLNKGEGKVFLSTGSKTLQTYCEGIDDINRLYARIRPLAKVIEECGKVGINGKNMICMEGPFSTEINYAMFQEVGAKYLVTREAGKMGGFEEQIEAARRGGMTAIVIGRPVEETGLPYEAVRSMLRRRYFPEDPEVEKEISIIGIGMGNPRQLTYEAREALNEAQAIVGAKRVIDALKDSHKPSYYAFKPDDILEFINSNPQYEKIALVYSGDIGFFSGAKPVLDSLHGWSIKMYCGIPTIAYLASKIQMSWESIKLISLHGREGKISLEVQQNQRVFALLGGPDSVKNLCRSLIDHGLSNVKIFVGERLSYTDERITEGTPEKLLMEEFDPLAAVIIENPFPVSADAQGIITHGLENSAFLRSEVPMTKSEIRSIAISKMQLYRNSVIYDIGAGTGSVTIETALQADMGHVYAIEQKPESAALIRENIKKFSVSNVTLVEGHAPEVFLGLEKPTHAFIGGSSGQMKEILDSLWKINPEIRVVLNTISLETLSDVMRYIETREHIADDIIQVGISKARVLGRYHLMSGENPIYIITLYRK